MLAHLNDMPSRGRWEIVKIGVVLSWNDLDVARTDWVCIEESHCKLVFVNQMRRKPAASDATEQTIGRR